MLFSIKPPSLLRLTSYYPIKSGITELDKVLHGFKGGDLNIIASRPSIGKTMLSLYMCSCMSTNGIKSLYISFERDEMDILKNILAIQTHLDITRMIEGSMKLSEFELLLDKAGDICDCDSLFVKSFYNANIITLKEFIKNAIETHKIQIVFIDYLSLIIPAPSYTNRWEQVSEVSRSLKTTAMEYKIPLIVLCPLNRNAVDNLPQISDLSESGSIEYDSDRIILLYEDKKDSDYEERRRGLKCEQKNLVTIDVAKNRRGALHKFDMIFDFGKAAVILQKKIIKPFKLARYADFELSTLEQIQRVPKDMQNHILNLVSEKSYEGNFLPWLDLLTPEVSVDEMETSNWKEFLASLAV